MENARPEKRKRIATDSSASCWDDAVDWIRSNGGTVHPALTFSSIDRSVQISVEHTEQSTDKDSSIPAGTVLMRIPSSCLLTVDAVSSTSYGKTLVDVIQNISSSSAIPLHNDASDLILAAYMAHVPSTSPADDLTSGHGAYLATLPPPSSYNSIPRRWDDEQLESLLGGTSLLAHVRKEQAALKSDYAVISTAWGKKHANGGISASEFPSFDQFDDMFSAVSSRGFAGLGSNDGDAMVPLLDLLDHRRGIDAKKDVRYQRSFDADDKGRSNATNAYVEVVADRDLSPGSTIHDTYGAKGNAQLLSRYGFCIPNNLEPDGSSNDVVELSLKKGCPVVELRAGPKSYTYGKFARMVEMFQEADGNEEAKNTNGQEEVSGMDDMEAFLNQCDEEEGGDDGDGCDGDDFDMMYGGMNGEDDEDEGDEEKMLESEYKALEQLSEALANARERYSLKDKEIHNALEKTDGSPRHFAAILVQSERRTMRLYELASIKILHRLKSMMTGSSLAEESEKGDQDNEDDELLLKAQIDELVSAYATIRHGGLM